MSQPRSLAAPLIAAVVTGAIMIGAILLWVFGRQDDAAAGGTQTYTSSEQAAVSAAGTEMANLTSFRRAHFEDDFKRALDGATGSLRSDITKQKAATLKTITDGKFDLSADVTHTALVGPVEADNVDGYVVLVSLNGFRSTQKNLPTQQNLQVTVVRTKGKWLVNDVKNIGVGS